MTRSLLEWRGGTITEVMRADGTIRYDVAPVVRAYRSTCCPEPACRHDPVDVLEVPVIDHRGQLMDRG